MTETTPRTVKVRIAVAVDRAGQWSAYGQHDVDDAMIIVSEDRLRDIEARYWLTAELPIPEAPEVAATVEPDAP